MIVVVGVGRTGTSAVARALQGMGVDMGGPADRSTHPDGSYEDPAFRTHTLQMTHGTMAPREWVAHVESAAARKAEPWGFKDPLLWQFIPLVEFAFPTARYVWVDRDLEATARSWALNVGGFEMIAARAEVAGRRFTIRRALKKRRHIRIDMTERRTEDELRASLARYVKLETTP